MITSLIHAYTYTHAHACIGTGVPASYILLFMFHLNTICHALLSIAAAVEVAAATAQSVAHVNTLFINADILKQHNVAI